jgi:ATP-dependent helicase/nuclease subunit B
VARRAAPDPLLAPPMLRALGIPGADFRIGLAAHDLAAMLGAPEVVLSYAERDAAARRSLRALCCASTRHAREERVWDDAVQWGRRSTMRRKRRLSRPGPCRAADQRRVDRRDRARPAAADPYQFYAASILGLQAIDPRDADPPRPGAARRFTPFWKPGTRRARPGELIPLAERAGGDERASVHAQPVAPRLLAALGWIEDEQDRLRARAAVAVRERAR